MHFKSCVIILFSILTFPLVAFSQLDEETNADSPSNSVHDANTDENEITVKPRYNFCNLEFMHRYIGKLGDIPELDPPQATDCLFGRCHPNFHVGAGATGLTGLPSANESRQVPREITVTFRGYHCDSGCVDSEFRKNRGAIRSNRVENEISLEYKIKITEIYDARFTDITVLCPLETCEGVISAEYSNTPVRVMLTKTKSEAGGAPLIKLYVNAGPGSIFTTSISAQSEINKCEKVEL